MSKKNGKKLKVLGSVVYLIVSIIAGALAWFIGERLFKTLTEGLFTPLGIALYFLMLFVILFIALVILLMKKLPAAQFKHKLKSSGTILLVVLLAFIVATGVFEFLYELGNNEIPEPTSLIFLIDDSGSMEGNEQYRVQAVNDVMKNSQLPFAVYRFTTSAQQLRNMDTYRSELTAQDLAFQSNGGTGIIPSVNDVLNDLESGMLTDAGESPKILLVSDGGSSSFGLRRIARKCRNRKVTISSIGMLGSSERLLKQIAEATGGVFVLCTDVSSLGDELTKAVASETDRNLLSDRIVYKNDALYAVLRILFLSLMGILWSALKWMLSAEEKNFGQKQFILSVALCTLGAFLMEFGTAAGLSYVFLRLIFDVLWTVSLGTFPKKAKISDIPSVGDNPVITITGQDVIGQDVDLIGSAKTGTDGVFQIGAVGNNESKTSEGQFDRQNDNGFFNQQNASAQNNQGFNNGTNDSKNTFFGKKSGTNNNGSGNFGGGNGTGGNGFFGN